MSECHPPINTICIITQIHHAEKLIENAVYTDCVYQRIYDFWEMTILLNLI